MAVQLPSSRASKVPTPVAVKRSFWRRPFFGRRGAAYQTLKDVDSPVKSKGSHDTINDGSEDMPLLKAGDPSAAKYTEKLSRRSAAEEEEPFIPRPNSRITFKLPNSTPSEDMQPEVMTMPKKIPAGVKEPDVLVTNATATVDLAAVSDVAPEEHATSANDMVPASDTTAGNEMVAANIMFPANSSAPAEEAKTLT